MTAATPKGIRLRIASHRQDSQLAQRLYGLWEGGGLGEMAEALLMERQQFDKAGATRCHDLAFEFAYGAVICAGGFDPSLTEWKWCIGKTTSRDIHSWIEHRGEAFDIVIGLNDESGEHIQVAYVRSAVELRAGYEAVAIEAKSLMAFADWLSLPHRNKLFPKYPGVSSLLSRKKDAIWKSGRVLLR
jgi:hypothetical protein